MDKIEFPYRAPLTCMVQADNPDRIKELMSLARDAGADSFGMQFERLRPEYRNKETYRELFEYAEDNPVYVTNYRLYENLGKSDGELAEELVEIAECGSVLVDVMGDLFSPSDNELTDDPDAVERQKSLIAELHRKGAVVLMSSHVDEFLSPECILEMAEKQKSRGVDVCKIVTQAKNKSEELQIFSAIDLLRKKLGAPFLLLCGGECRAIRLFGAHFGNCTSLCVYEYDKFATKEQPLLADMKMAEKLL